MAKAYPVSQDAITKVIKPIINVPKSNVLKGRAERSTPCTHVLMTPIKLPLETKVQTAQIR